MGKLNTVDLLVPTSLDKLLFVIETIIYLGCQTSYLNEEVNCTDPSPSVSVPCCMKYLILQRVPLKKYINFIHQFNNYK
jgi:hypothetical protein